jgi:precorrin-6Y C5,15-methyltransferase (decarboxylating)
MAGISWDDASFISVHGRPIEGVVAKLQRATKVGIFTDEENSPQRLAARLLEFNACDYTAILCENLCGPDERLRRFSLEELSLVTDVSPLNVLILEKKANAEPRPALLDLVPEEDYGKRMPKKGLITKKEVRVLSIAAMALREESVVWDIGAGSGSISVEAGRLASRGEIYAIECDAEGIEFIEDNAKSFGMDQIRAVKGLAPAALEDLPRPNAVFIGGSKGSMSEIVDIAAKELLAGGRLVINAVTLENVAEAHKAMKRLGWPFDMSQISISRGIPLAKKYLRYEALNPIHMFYTEKPLSEDS